MPADFAFRLEHGSCTTDMLDTFEGLYVRDLDGDRAHVSARVSLAPESLAVVYRAVQAARFFEYPAEFRSSGSGWMAPGAHYRLEVLSGGRRHTVEWVYDRIPSTAQENRLREMFITIVQEVQRNPEVSKLPKARVSCR
jgi:hypothetical protein